MVDINSSFKKNGYYIFSNIFSEKDIDPIIDELYTIRAKKRKPNYFSQATHRIVPFNFDKYGYLSESIQGFTRQWNIKRLANPGKEILLGSKMLTVLKSIFPQFKDFVQQNNMLFDKSMETIDHIDSWYLDTNPYGNLLAVWVALEDINGDGGSFHVYPKSHLDRDFDWIGIDHDGLLEWSISKYSKYEKKSILLSKGDLLVWHPLLVHGSSLQKINGASRKSITAHYCPTNYLMGGGGLKDSQDTYEYKKLLKKQINNTRNFGYPIRARRSRKKIAASSIYGLTRYLVDLGNNPKMKMNRSFYK